jgi:hypothetical protein
LIVVQELQIARVRQDLGSARAPSRAGFGALAKTVFSGRPCVGGMLTESEEVRDGGGAVASTHLARALPNRKDIPDEKVLW